MRVFIPTCINAPHLHGPPDWLVSKHSSGEYLRDMVETNRYSFIFYLSLASSSFSSFLPQSEKTQDQTSNWLQGRGREMLCGRLFVFLCGPAVDQWSVQTTLHPLTGRLDSTHTLPHPPSQWKEEDTCTHFHFYTLLQALAPATLRDSNQVQQVAVMHIKLFLSAHLDPHTDCLLTVVTFNNIKLWCNMKT